VLVRPMVDGAARGGQGPGLRSPDGRSALQYPAPPGRYEQQTPSIPDPHELRRSAVDGPHALGTSREPREGQRARSVQDVVGGLIGDTSPLTLAGAFQRASTYRSGWARSARTRIGEGRARRGVNRVPKGWSARDDATMRKLAMDVARWSTLRVERDLGWTLVALGARRGSHAWVMC